MVLKLYANYRSTCGRRVAAILVEKKVPFKLFAAENIKGEAWLEHQPFGQMPYIDDDGFILFESRAIGRYVAAKWASSGTPLLPNSSDIKAVARFEQAASIETSNFEPGASGIAKEKVFKPMFGGQTDPAFLEFYEKSITGRLDGFERLLKKQKYLAGDEISAIDIFCLSYGHMMTESGYDYLKSEKWPNVARWWADISSRPSWQLVKNGIPEEYKGE